ncbi:MAG TPA: (Fe-S)-binding protein [Pyrinomonadaceae bacterium]|nr:(Fe-S)-binding protein [Pyrinomonadaceae bacterium]
MVLAERMKVALFVTCLVDQICPEVGMAAVEVLERAGCEVEFDARQTCCGQPAFNTGYRDEAREFAKRWIGIFESSDAEAIVSPSGSCTAMVRHFAELFADDEEWRQRAESIACRTYEFTEFLVDVLKTDDVGSSFEGKLTWHDACHALRDLGVRDAPRRLLGNVKGAELIEHVGADECCGFGGTFSVKYAEISAAIADRKTDNIEASGASVVAACDASCLMQIGGRLGARGSKVRALHIAEVLASRKEG